MLRSESACVVILRRTRRCPSESLVDGKVTKHGQMLTEILIFLTQLLHTIIFFIVSALVLYALRHCRAHVTAPAARGNLGSFIGRLSLVAEWPRMHTVDGRLLACRRRPYAARYLTARLVLPLDHVGYHGSPRSGCVPRALEAIGSQLAQAIKVTRLP